MMSFLSSEKVNKGRQFEVDCVKSWAILFMICIHFYEQFGAYDYDGEMPDTLYRNIIEFVGGPLAAPVFMFCMGIGMIYTKHNSSVDFIKRGIKLILMGYSLNFFRQGLPLLIAKAIRFEVDMDIIGGLLCVDILPFAGMAFISIGLMKKGKLTSVTMCEIAFLMQAIGIWVTKLHFKPGVIQNLIGLIIPTGEWTAFSLTLWLVYPTLGMLFGEFLERCEDKNQMYKKLMILSGIFIAAYTSGLLFIGRDIRYSYALCDELYYRNNIINTLWIIPVIILALGTCHFLFSKLEEKKYGSLIRYCSVNLNTIYIIQWIIIAYSVVASVLLDIENTYSPGILILGGAIVAIISIGISKPIVKIKKKRRLQTN